jgi:EF-P beta-lysylation protein EpmB
LGPDADLAERAFRLRVPRGLVSRIRPGRPKDPILRQILPTDEEARVVPGFVGDPLGEESRVADGGIVQKYRGRALIVLTGACAVHCRYCFRRHFPYEKAGDIDLALERVANDSSISEVILSGGDPLMLSDDRLDRILDSFEGLTSIRRIRIHTRIPVVLPQRIDQGLLGLLSGRTVPIVIVIHANHAQELSEDVRIACSAMAERGITLLNQTVLLEGINDDAESLVDLSQTLFDCRVLPYYLHLLDKVAGAAHFDVEEQRAKALMAEVSARLPGYLVPRLVREVEGAGSKVVLSPFERSTSNVQRSTSNVAPES